MRYGNDGTLVFAALFGLATAVPVHAGLCLPPRASANDPVRYLDALVGALEHAKSGRERTATSGSKNDGELDGITDLMTNIKIADQDYACALDHVRPYAESDVKAIATSASGMVTAMESLIAIDKRVVAMFKDLLNRGSADGRLGDMAEQMADVGAKADDTWKMLPIAIAAATYVIIEVDPATGKYGRLVLTADERSQVLARLRAIAGADVKDGAKAGQKPLEFSVAALHGFIADVKWKSRGDK